jgi:hypothetical protein
MKESELRQLIREEIKKSLQEANPAMTDENMGKAQMFVGKTIKKVAPGVHGSIIFVFNDGSQLTVFSQKPGREKAPAFSVR